MKSLLEAQGFPVICLDSVWNDLDQETAQMEELIARRRIEKLLIDSYFVTPDYLARLNRLTYLIYLDDLNQFVYPCSELINYNIYASQYDYPSRYPNTRLFLGPKYAPLREEFRDLPPRQIRGQAESVLVTTGGNDPDNIAGLLAERAKNYADLARLHFHIVAGKYNTNVPRLQALAERRQGITIHQNVSHMATLMYCCDIAVSAGGSTLYELCACGTPSVIFSCADNQQMAVSAFGKGYMLDCGDIRQDKEQCVEKLLAGIVRLSGNAKLRTEMSGMCMELLHQTF